MDFGNGVIVIGDDTPTNEYEAVSVANNQAKGLIPRDYNEFPQGCYASAPAWDLASLPLVPWDEIPYRIAWMTETKTRLVDIGDYVDPLDQNGQGYCWFYSGTSAIMQLRARNNQPNVRLSAHSGAWVIKEGKDQGGWGAAGLDFQKERGVVPVSLWKEKSMDGRTYNTEANWAAAKEFRVTEGFVDLQPPAYDRDLTIHQILSCFLNRIPVISDYNWWGHSVCGLWAYDYKPSLPKNNPMRYSAVEILNSWAMWSRRGRGILKDSKAFPNGASAPRATWGN